MVRGMVVWELQFLGAVKPIAPSHTFLTISYVCCHFGLGAPLGASVLRINGGTPRTLSLLCVAKTKHISA